MKRFGHRRQSISRKLKNEKGEIEAACGLFFLLFLFLFLMAQLELFRYETSALYAEDALAASNLASALIDWEEYGMSHRISVKDYEQAYERYQAALKTNLGLNDMWECKNDALISGKVQVGCYVVYNVQDEEVVWHCREGDGTWVTGTGLCGSVYTPGGQPVTHTGIYSEIAYEVKGMTGITLHASQSKLVDVVSDYK